MIGGRNHAIGSSSKCTNHLLLVSLSGGMHCSRAKYLAESDGLRFALPEPQDADSENALAKTPGDA
jgi:hypothetical protein